MSRRFIPPAVAAFGDGPEADFARIVAQAREEGFAEGRNAGFEAGREAGLSEGRSAADAQHEANLALLQQKSAKNQATLAVTTALGQVLTARTSDLLALEDAARTAIVATLRALFPTLMEQAAGQEIAALLAEALTERAPEALMLRAHPATLRSVAAHDLPGGHAASLTMLDDATMSLGVAEIIWTGGGLTFDLAAMHERVVAILSPIGKEQTA